MCIIAIMFIVVIGRINESEALEFAAKGCSKLLGRSVFKVPPKVTRSGCFR